MPPLPTVQSSSSSKGSPVYKPKLSPEEARTEHVTQAMRYVTTFAIAKFDETVDIAIDVNMDVGRTDEKLRGIANLPHSTGKTVRVCVFARGEKARAAIEAGAEVVGDDDLVQQVINGRMDFDRVIATPDMLPVIAKAARVLGPKGMMPSPKRGSVVSDVAAAVTNAKVGEVDFKGQREGVVHASVGKVSHPTEHLIANTLALIDGVLKARPQRLQVKPVHSISLTSTQGPCVKLDPVLWKTGGSKK
jgi:large subunit ribosomal protein L1